MSKQEDKQSEVGREELFQMVGCDAKKYKTMAENRSATLAQIYTVVGKQGQIFAEAQQIIPNYTADEWDDISEVGVHLVHYMSRLKQIVANVQLRSFTHALAVNKVFGGQIKDLPEEKVRQLKDDIQQAVGREYERIASENGLTKEEFDRL